MFVALAIAVLIGAVVAGITILDARWRIADEARVAFLVCISGSVAGWALVDTITGLTDESISVFGIIGAIIGAAVIATAAWRGRRRTFDELGPTPHSE